MTLPADATTREMTTDARLNEALRRLSEANAELDRYADDLEATQDAFIAYRRLVATERYEDARMLNRLYDKAELAERSPEAVDAVARGLVDQQRFAS